MIIMKEDKRENQSDLQKIIDKNADSIVLVNEDGHILYLNRAAESLFGDGSGLGIGEMFGFPVTAGETTELDMKGKDGDRVVVEMRVVNVDWNGEPACLASLRDVTQRKITEAALEKRVLERTAELQKVNRELNKMYQDASRAAETRKQFVANVSHEVRTPLSGIVTSAELLQYAEGEEAKELATIVLNSSKQLLYLVETILDFSKLEAGRVSVTKTPFEIKELIEIVVESFYLTAKKKKVALKTSYDDALPLTIVGDALKVRQVLLNLVNNAIKFTEEGTVAVFAEVEDEGSVVKVSVKDSGIGMNAAECNNIFQPFVQANQSIQGNYGGTGLGLAICKELLNVVGGNIGFCSEPGAGSTFWFTFPCETSTDEAGASEDA
ncbi:MAG TPA: ATP-binding protein [Oculatellaceae cyanobacterium]